ncbi:hypothetical protein DFAR_2980012 [Desulfarculales bacterium]
MTPRTTSWTMRLVLGLALGAVLLTAPSPPQADLWANKNLVRKFYRAILNND